jgi:large subunit ribosomal protein L6
MARIGNRPVPFGEDVTVSVDDENTVTVEGPKGALSEQIDTDLQVRVGDGEVTVNRPSDQKRHRAVHGLSRSLLQNMVEGVTEGYQEELKIIGVGYRAQVSNGALELALGYSHPIYFLPPEPVSVSVDTDRGSDDIIIVEGVDKELVGQVAAKIRSMRPPEPYKGKGVRYVDEEITLKAGKTAAR